MEIPVILTLEETDLLMIAMRVFSRYDDMRVVIVANDILRKLEDARSQKVRGFKSRLELRDEEF